MIIGYIHCHTFVEIEELKKEILLSLRLMPLLLHTDSFNLSPGSCIAVSLNECSSSEAVTLDEVGGFITLASKRYIPNFQNPDLIVLG